MRDCRVYSNICRELCNVVDPFLSKYGNTGYGVSSLGIQNFNDQRMCSYENFNGLMASSQKIENFDLWRLILKYFDQKHVQISNPA